jgi:excisionase family DNA binding protein
MPRTAAAPDILGTRLFLRVQEFAELTGTPVASVYRYVASGELPSRRIGSTIRIPVSAVCEELKGAR